MVMRTGKNSQFYLFLVVSGIFLLSSCKEPVNHNKHIPDNAAIVAVVDVQRMTVKAFDMSILLEENLFDFEKSEPQDKNSKIPIHEAGIDFLNKSYLIGHVADEEADNYFGVILPLSDHDVFRKFALSHATKKPNEGNSNVSYVLLGDAAILGWSKETAIYLRNQEVFDEKALVGEVYRLFSLPEENQMMSQNKDVKSILSDNHDLSFWLNLEKLNKYRNPFGTIIPGQKVSKGVFKAWINFEKGLMDVKTRYFVDEFIDSEKKSTLVLKDNIDKSLLRGIATDDIVGSVNLGFNMDVLKDQINSGGSLDSSQGYLSMFNTSGSEILEMLSGDLVTCLISKQNDKPDFFVALGLKDQQTSKKIIKSLKDFGLLTEKDGHYVALEHYFVSTQDNRLIITSAQKTIDDITKGSSMMPTNDFVDDLDNNPLVISLDFNRMGTAQYNKLKKAWKIQIDASELEKLHYTQSAVVSGASEGRATVTFKNKDKNCLITIARALKKYSDEVGV